MENIDVVTHDRCMQEMGVRTDVPFQELTKEEKEIVYHGPAEKKHIFYKAKIQTSPANLILHISMLYIPWRMPYPK